MIAYLMGVATIPALLAVLLLFMPGNSASRAHDLNWPASKDYRVQPRDCWHYMGRSTFRQGVSRIWFALTWRIPHAYHESNRGEQQ